MWKAMSKSEQQAMVEECFAYDDVLRASGSWTGSGEALQGAPAAKTLRWKAGRMLVTDGPYAETKEQLGGFVVLQLTDINQAIELCSKNPGLPFGVAIEVRPADEEIGALAAARLENATGK